MISRLLSKCLNRREQREYWQSSPDTYSYNWLKKIVIVLFLFGAVYELHVTNTIVTPYVDSGVKYILSTEIDASNLTEQLKTYARVNNIDLAVFNKVKTTLSRPADPLLYMQRPTNGKVVVPYGWRNDPVLKREIMQEGIIFDASPSGHIAAAAAGTVKILTENTQYGKVLIIDHGKNIETLYGHLSETAVMQGEMVSKGQIIGKTFNKNTTGIPTVYFEVHENGKAIDPLKRLGGETAAEGK